VVAPRLFLTHFRPRWMYSRQVLCTIINRSRLKVLESHRFVLVVDASGSSDHRHCLLLEFWDITWPVLEHTAYINRLLDIFYIGRSTTNTSFSLLANGIDRAGDQRKIDQAVAQTLRLNTNRVGNPGDLERLYICGRMCTNMQLHNRWALETPYTQPVRCSICQ
jgi:hypothetical protein